MFMTPSSVEYYNCVQAVYRNLKHCQIGLSTHRNECIIKGNKLSMLFPPTYERERERERERESQSINRKTNRNNFMDKVWATKIVLKNRVAIEIGEMASMAVRFICSVIRMFVLFCFSFAFQIYRSINQRFIKAAIWYGKTPVCGGGDLSPS